MALEGPTSLDTNAEDGLEEMAPNEMTAPMPEAPPRPPGMTVMTLGRRLRICTRGAPNLRRNRGKPGQALKCGNTDDNDRQRQGGPWGCGTIRNDMDKSCSCGPLC